MLIPKPQRAELMALVHLLPQALWFGSDVVLALTEAQKLSSENNAFLAEGRVVILTASK